MKIGINASFLRKTDTGIGQVTQGFVQELMKSHSKKNEYFLYLEKDIDFKLPKNFQKRVFLPQLLAARRFGPKNLVGKISAAAACQNKTAARFSFLSISARRFSEKYPAQNARP